MAAEEQKGDRGFTVVDKRASTSSEQPAEASAREGERELPRVDFARKV